MAQGKFEKKENVFIDGIEKKGIYIYIHLSYAIDLQWEMLIR